MTKELTNVTQPLQYWNPQWPIYACAFQLNVEKIQKAKQDFTEVLDSVLKSLTESGFDSVLAGGIYISENLQSVVKLISSLKKYQKNLDFFDRFHVFRMEDYTDILPILNGKISTWQHLVLTPVPIEKQNEQ